MPIPIEKVVKRGKKLTPLELETKLPKWLSPVQRSLLNLVRRGVVDAYWYKHAVYYNSQGETTGQVLN